MIVEAKNWYAMGCAHLDNEENDAALEAFTNASVLEPDYPLLRNRIALCELKLGDNARAVALAEALVRSRPRDAIAWETLAEITRICKMWDRALEAASRAFELDSKLYETMFSYALVIGEFGRLKERTELLERIIKVYPKKLSPYAQLGRDQLRDGDYALGQRHFEARFWMHKAYRWFLAVPLKVWQGGSLEGKTVLLLPEQGLGDEIMFVRYVAVLLQRARAEGGRIRLICTPTLKDIFRRSLPNDEDVLTVLGVDELNAEVAANRAFYEQPNLLKSVTPSLPLYLRETVGDRFPYLVADSGKVDDWLGRLAGDKGLKVGVAWTGREDHYRNNLRSVPVAGLVQALKLEGVSLYSLQQSHPEEAKQLGLIDYTHEWQSVDDTAAFLCNLDLIVAADVMVAHLAGALHLPAWVLVDINPHYSWGAPRYGRKTPWYPGVTVYRQQKFRDWTSVFAEVRKDLIELVAVTHPRSHPLRPPRAAISVANLPASPCLDNPP